MKRVSISLICLVVLSFVLVFGVSPVSAEPYGWSPDVNKSTTEAPGPCTGDKPPAPILYQPNHPVLPRPKGPGQVRLQWVKVSGATGYTIYYGLSPKNYIYSVQLAESIDNYTISYLGNRVYYFAIQAKKGCASGKMSMEWGARPNGGAFLSTTVGSVPSQRTAVPTAPVVGNKTPAPTTAPSVAPVQPSVQQPAPVAPAPRRVAPPAAPKQPGFFQSFFNFLGGLFK